MKYAYLVATLACTVVCSAQPKLEMQSTYDWGTVVPKNANDRTITASVPMKNVGTSVLRIAQLRPGCSCTSAKVDKDSLMPGEETNMNLTFNLPLINGPMKKYVTVVTNEPEPNTHALNLTVSVERALQIGSAFIAFNAATVGIPTHGVIEFTVQQKAQPVTITVADVPKHMGVVTPLPLVIQPGTTARLEVTYTPPTGGPFHVMLTVQTTVDGFESITLSGHGNADPKR